MLSAEDRFYRERGARAKARRRLRYSGGKDGAVEGTQVALNQQILEKVSGTVMTATASTIASSPLSVSMCDSKESRGTCRRGLAHGGRRDGNHGDEFGAMLETREEGNESAKNSRRKKKEKDSGKSSKLRASKVCA